MADSEDDRLLALAIARSRLDIGTRYELADVVKELDIDRQEAAE